MARTVQEIDIDAGGVTLTGDLAVPYKAAGLVIFAHGSGSSRFSPRNRFVAEHLQKKGFGTLLFDLLTRREEEAEVISGVYRFDIPLLCDRLIGATDQIKSEPALADLQVGYFGASTGAAAALTAASQRPDVIQAVVSRGGRPDMAEGLERVKAPTLLIVGSQDLTVLTLNQQAYDDLNSEKALHIVKGATHLFEEPGALERVADLAGAWFSRYLNGKESERRNR